MTRQTYLDAIKDKLYGDSAVAKIWGVAYPALSEAEPPVNSLIAQKVVDIQQRKHISGPLGFFRDYFMPCKKEMKSIRITSLQKKSIPLN